MAALGAARGVCRLTAVARQHLADRGLGGRAHGEAVGPALLPEVVLDGALGVGDADAGGLEVAG